VLRRQGLSLAPRRGRTTWRAFLGRHRDQLLACDFFTVDRLFLQRLYVLLFIEIGSGRGRPPMRCKDLRASSTCAMRADLTAPELRCHSLGVVPGV
jgi:hypothetical protein